MFTIKKNLLLIFCFFQPAFGIPKKVFSAAYESALGEVQEEQVPVSNQKFSLAYRSASKDQAALSHTQLLIEKREQEEALRAKEVLRIKAGDMQSLAACVAFADAKRKLKSIQAAAVKLSRKLYQVDLLKSDEALALKRAAGWIDGSKFLLTIDAKTTQKDQEMLPAFNWATSDDQRELKGMQDAANKTLHRFSQVDLLLQNDTQQMKYTSAVLKSTTCGLEAASDILKQVFQKKYVFECIKNAAERSPHRVKDWSKLHALLDADKLVTTNCYNADLFLFHILRARNIQSLCVFSTRSNEREFGGNYDSFANDGMATGGFKHQVADALFSQHHKKHAFFWVRIGDAHKNNNGQECFNQRHGFVIERIKNRYRIYQSFYLWFSLGQWVGVDKWPKQWKYKSPNAGDASKEFDAQYKVFGQGRMGSLKDLKAFLETYAKNPPFCRQSINGCAEYPFICCCIMNPDYGS